MEDGTMLEKIGRSLPFEIAIGHNGRIWVRGESPRVPRGLGCSARMS